MGLEDDVLDREAAILAKHRADPLVGWNAVLDKQLDKRAAKTARAERRAGASMEPLTEWRAAELFAEAKGADYRFDYRRQRFLKWDGHRFRLDEDGEIQRDFAAFARTLQRDALELPDLKEREDWFKAALRLEKRNESSNVLHFVKAIRPIADAGDQWDANPMLLSVSNGVVELRTGTLRPGRHEDRITRSTGVPFDPTARCPRWKQFLREVFAAEDALVVFVKRAVGYSLTAETIEQLLFLLYGVGANGKTTFLNALKRVFGDYAWNMPFTTIELRDRSAIPNDLAMLAGRRFVTASETNDGTRLNEARVKALTGGDPITARFLHAEFFTFRPAAKLWLSVNHRPVVRDDSLGFWRRIRLVPFTQTFAPNPDLPRELAAEAPGILAWAVEGCLEWQREGLGAPPSVLEATSRYEADSDALRAFLEEDCTFGPDEEVSGAELFGAYRAWAVRHGLGPREMLTATAFGRKAGERFEAARGRHGKVYRGLRPRAVTGLGQ